MAKNLVTEAELSALEERVMDLCADLHAVADRVEKQFSVGDVQAPIRHALVLTGLSGAAMRVARVILIIASNAEDRALLEAKLKGDHL